MVGDIFDRTNVAVIPARSGSVRARVISGATLAVLAVVATLVGGIWFPTLVMAIALAMCWEWGQIVRGPEGLSPTLVVHAGGVIIASVLMASGHGAAAAIVLCVAALGTALLAPGNRLFFSAAGVLYVGFPALALIWLRSDVTFGTLAVLYLFSVVWMTDTFAYISGKLIGGVRLWPSLSRQKTWAGLIGGVTMGGVAGAVFGQLAVDGSPVMFAAAAAFLAVASQCGDLVESAIKRNFGVKNASNLIPGHGGVMDRMDGIVGAIAGASVLVLATNFVEPARALLMVP